MIYCMFTSLVVHSLHAAAVNQSVAYFSLIERDRQERNTEKLKCKTRRGHMKLSEQSATHSGSERNRLSVDGRNKVNLWFFVLFLLCLEMAVAELNNNKREEELVWWTREFKSKENTQIVKMTNELVAEPHDSRAWKRNEFFTQQTRQWCRQ